MSRKNMNQKEEAAQGISLQIAREEMATQAALAAFKNMFLLNGACGVTLLNLLPKAQDYNLIYAAGLFFLGSFFSIVAMTMSWNENMFKCTPNSRVSKSKRKINKDPFDTPRAAFISTKLAHYLSILCATIGFAVSIPFICQLVQP